MRRGTKNVRTDSDGQMDRSRDGVQRGAELKIKGGRICPGGSFPWFSFVYLLRKKTDDKDEDGGEKMMIKMEIMKRR